MLLNYTFSSSSSSSWSEILFCLARQVQAKWLLPFWYQNKNNNQHSALLLQLWFYATSATTKSDTKDIYTHSFYIKMCLSFFQIKLRILWKSTLSESSHTQFVAQMVVFSLSCHDASFFAHPSFSHFLNTTTKHQNFWRKSSCFSLFLLLACTSSFKNARYLLHIRPELCHVTQFVSFSTNVFSQYSLRVGLKLLLSASLSSHTSWQYFG